MSSKSRKNFKANNPAMQFISNPAESDAVQLETATLNDETGGVNHDASIAEATIPIHQSGSQQSMSPFDGLPVLQETKSRRLQLLLKPSTYGGLEQLAKSHSTSVNNVINLILEKYLGLL